MSVCGVGGRLCVCVEWEGVDDECVWSGREVVCVCVGGG